MSFMAVVAYTSNPYLTLLPKLIVIYAIAAKSGRRDSDSGSAIITRSESKAIRADDSNSGNLASDAQELLDLFYLMPKFRNGETRLFPRMLDCIKKIAASNNG